MGGGGEGAGGSYRQNGGERSAAVQFNSTGIYLRITGGDSGRRGCASRICEDGRVRAAGGVGGPSGYSQTGSGAEWPWDSEGQPATETDCLGVIELGGGRGGLSRLVRAGDGDRFGEAPVPLFTASQHLAHFWLLCCALSGCCALAVLWCVAALLPALLCCSVALLLCCSSLLLLLLLLH